MQRVTVSFSENFAAELEAFMVENGYDNRSEALRDLARTGLDRAKVEQGGTGDCVATLTYVYDHRAREIPKRLAENFHGHHDLSVATLHVHLDHENCLEVAVLRGDTGAVRDFSKRLIAERGIKHGRVTFVPVEIEMDRHEHGTGDVPQSHAHTHPKG